MMLDLEIHSWTVHKIIETFIFLIFTAEEIALIFPERRKTRKYYTFSIGDTEYACL